MSLLKKIGSWVLKIVGIWPSVAGLVSPGLAGTIGSLLAVITTVEQTFTAAYGIDGKKGSDKLRAATPFVAQLIQQTDALVGKKPKDEAMFQDAATRLTAALADILNSYGE